MTDRELSVEVERLMRLEGCLGIFRVFGQSMDCLLYTSEGRTDGEENAETGKRRPEKGKMHPE